MQLRGQLEALREQKKELEKTAKFASAGLLSSGQGEFVDPSAAANFDRGLVAKNKLNSPEFQTALQGMQKEVDKLAEKVLGIEAAVPKAENQLNAANSAITDISAAVETNIQRIEETLAADTLVAKSETLVATGEQFATDIKSAFEKIEASTEIGKAAKEIGLTAVADGKITADDQADVAKSFQVLMGQLQSGQAVFSGNIRDLIALQQEFLRAGQANSIQIQQLKVQAQQQAAAIKVLYSRGL